MFKFIKKLFGINDVIKLNFYTSSTYKLEKSYKGFHTLTIKTNNVGMGISLGKRVNEIPVQHAIHGDGTVDFSMFKEYISNVILTENLPKRVIKQVREYINNIDLNLYESKHNIIVIQYGNKCLIINIIQRRLGERIKQ